MRHAPRVATALLLLVHGAAAAQIAAPTFPNVSEYLLQSYPANAIQRGQSSAALVEFWTDLRGKIFDCRLITSVGSEELAGKTCGILRKRRIVPARGADNMPAIGRMRNLIRFSLPGTDQGALVEQTVERPDVELAVGRLPEGKAAYEFTLVLGVSSEGKIERCEAPASALDAYVTAACTNVSTLVLPPGRGPEGNPTSYVTDAKVRFTLSAG